LSKRFSALLRLFFLAVSFVVMSCAHIATGMDESSQSYYKWRINKTYNQIFWGTDVWQLEYLVFADKGEELKEKVKREGIDISEKGIYGISLLSWAAGANLQSVVKALLEFGADPDYINEENLSIMAVAIFSRNVEMVEILLPYMENVYFAKIRDGKLVDPYIMGVIQYKQEAMLELFIQNGFDPDWSYDRVNPLSSAIMGGEDKSYKLALNLLNSGARPDTNELEREWFIHHFQLRPFGDYFPEPHILNYESDLYGELYQRMIGFGVSRTQRSPQPVAHRARERA
jgi:hypothetical protein